MAFVFNAIYYGVQMFQVVNAMDKGSRILSKNAEGGAKASTTETVNGVAHLAFGITEALTMGVGLAPLIHGVRCVELETIGGITTSALKYTCYATEALNHMSQKSSGKSTDSKPNQNQTRQRRYQNHTGSSMNDSFPTNIKVQNNQQKATQMNSRKAIECLEYIKEVELFVNDPLSFSYLPSWHKRFNIMTYLSSSSSKEIRHIVVPYPKDLSVDLDESICYEKEVLMEWLDARDPWGKPYAPPKSWPVNIPFDKEHVSPCPIRQYVIDKGLKLMADALKDELADLKSEYLKIKFEEYQKHKLREKCTQGKV